MANGDDPLQLGWQCQASGGIRGGPPSGGHPDASVPTAGRNGPLNGQTLTLPPKITLMWMKEGFPTWPVLAVQISRHSHEPEGWRAASTVCAEAALRVLRA